MTDAPSRAVRVWWVGGGLAPSWPPRTAPCTPSFTSSTGRTALDLLEEATGGKRTRICHWVILRVNLSWHSRKDCTNDCHGHYRPRLLEEQPAQASPDLLRELLTTFVDTPMSAEADAVRGASYGTEDQRVAATEAARADEGQQERSTQD